MKKIILTLMLCCGFVIAAQAQVLYRISGNGLTKPSYIIGSHHLANVAFVNQIPGAKMALDSTEQVYGELKMDPNSMQATQQEIMKNMMLGEGQKINQVLSADQMKRVNAFMMKTMQTDFNNPAVMQQMGSMKPAALSTNFTVLLYPIRPVRLTSISKSRPSTTTSLWADWRRPSSRPNCSTAILFQNKLRASCAWSTTPTSRCS